MATTNATNRAHTADLRATGARLLALGTSIAAAGAWAWTTGPTVDAVLVIACGVAIAAFGALQVVIPGALLGEADRTDSARPHATSTHAEPLPRPA